MSMFLKNWNSPYRAKEDEGGEGEIELQGGPEDGGDPAGDGVQPDPEPEEKSPSMEKMTVGGVEYDVPPEVAAAYAEQNSGMAEMRGSIESLRSDINKPPVVEEQGDPYAQYEEMLFTDPAGAVKKITETIKAEVMTDVRSAYTAETSQKDFWSGFYKDNKDLKDADMIVQSVMTRDWESLKALDTADASKKMADSARKELLKLGVGKGKKTETVHTESGGTQDRPAGAGNDDTDNVQEGSTVGILRKRANARREAAAKLR
jgi:hypothetical protein